VDELAELLWLSVGGLRDCGRTAAYDGFLFADRWGYQLVLHGEGLRCREGAGADRDRFEWVLRLDDGIGLV
jgi:hypothetical protein